jgi:hypothetical protein
MPDFQLSRSIELSHHVVQGRAWLEACSEGAHSVPLTYAAFEFRLAIERPAMQYLGELRGRLPREEDLDALRTFKTMEKLIYSLGGNQKQINGHFAFMRLVLSCLKIEHRLTTPDFGKLSSYWAHMQRLLSHRWHVGVA